MPRRIRESRARTNSRTCTSRGEATGEARVRLFGSVTFTLGYSGRKVCEVLKHSVKRLKPLKRGSRCPTSQLLRLALLALEQRRPKRGEEGT